MNEPTDEAKWAEFRNRLAGWRAQLPRSVSVEDLQSRCDVAHKWQATFRSVIVREALLRRMHDLGNDMVLLVAHQRVLGVRILLRCALETTCLLVYWVGKAEAVVDGTSTWWEFDHLTTQLVLGSKNESTDVQAVNILTAVTHANRKYPWIEPMHQTFSESVHPNFDGVTMGYVQGVPDDLEVHFGNYWATRFGRGQASATQRVFELFECFYDLAWAHAMEQLEDWLRAHDGDLERERAARRKTE